MLQVLTDEQLVESLINASVALTREGPTQGKKDQFDAYRKLILDTLVSRKASEKAALDNLIIAVEKWTSMERDYVLPAFDIAESIGFDLQKAVLENPGKNCTILLFERLLADRAMAISFACEDAKTRNSALAANDVDIADLKRRVTLLETRLELSTNS